MAQSRGALPRLHRQDAARAKIGILEPLDWRARQSIRWYTLKKILTISRTNGGEGGIRNDGTLDPRERDLASGDKRVALLLRKGILKMLSAIEEPYLSKKFANCYVAAPHARRPNA
jgi:hypothetical protein